MGRMRIKRVDTFLCDAGWRPWIFVKVETDDGLVGWGEACSGADVVSVEAALHAMKPFVVGRDPWNREAMRADLWSHGLWQFRPMTGNFAWAGVDMALWDLCGKACGQPLWHLFGGLRRREVSYFYYLAQAEPAELAAQCRSGLDAAFWRMRRQVWSANSSPRSCCLSKERL